MASGITGQAAPAAADVQQAQAGSQTQPLANPIQLPQLRGGEIVAFSEQRTGILHIRIEHRFEEIVAQIVMYPADFSGAPRSLLVREKPGEQCPDIAQSQCETRVPSGPAWFGDSSPRRPGLRSRGTDVQSYGGEDCDVRNRCKARVANDCSSFASPGEYYKHSGSL